MAPTRKQMRELVETGDLQTVRAVALELIDWIAGLKAAGIPVEADERGPCCGGTMTSGRCEACAELVPAIPKPEPLDMTLLDKFASGEGGLRTGALKRAGYLDWAVTGAGHLALNEWRKGRPPSDG